MAATMDAGGFQAGLSVDPFRAARADEARPSVALVPVEPAPGDEAARSRYAIPLLLVAGWGGLFAYCATYLREDLPFRPQAAETALRAEEPPRRIVLLPTPEAAAPPAEAQAAPEAEHPVAAVAAPPAAAAPKPGPAAASPDYVGTWGPTPAACGSPSRRRGYLPATITAERARAGRTVCSFHDGHRAGNGWLMAAECSDRGRRWSSQVRLVVDGDRLTWTSSRGSAAYVRCGRRAG